MNQKEDKYTLLCVFCSEDHIPSFDRVLCHEKIRKSYQKKLKVRLSTYENFLENKLEDTYDFVLIIFMEDVGVEELEAQNDHYIHYAQVPIVHYAVSSKMVKSENYDYLKSFVKEHLDQRLVDPNPCILDENTSTAAASLANALEIMVEAYKNKKDTEVAQAFRQFDADGSGAIDKDELQSLSKQLGHPLTDNQLDKALQDLDLNHDGVIDFDEFCRWYFTGMKPYNNSTRSMLQVGSKTANIFDAMAKEKLVEMIQADKSTSKHRFSIGFNEPAEAYVTQASIHFCGPFTEAQLEKAAGFRELLGSDLKEEVGQKYMNIYLECKIPMKDGSNYKPHVRAIEKILEEKGFKDKDCILKFFPMDKELLIRFYLSVANSMAPSIPDVIRDAFKDTDQYMKFKAVVGVDAEEILTADKPLLEHLMKGFKFSWELVFLKNIKKILLEEMKRNESSQEALEMMGPAFALTSNSSVDLSFDDFDEIKEHPMADSILLSLGQVIQGAFGSSVSEMLKYKHEFKDVKSKADLDKYIKTSEYCYFNNQQLELYNAIASLLKEFAADFNVTLEGHMFGFMGLKYDLQGAGYGDLALLLFNCFTQGQRDRLSRNIVSDFNDSKDQSGDAQPDGMM